jgi:hypothetical protein
MSLTQKAVIKQRILVVVSAVEVSRVPFAEFIDECLDEGQETLAGRKAAKLLASSMVCQFMIDCLVDLVVGYDQASEKVWLNFGNCGRNRY